MKQQALTALSVNRKRKGADARSRNRATTVQNYQAPESLLARDVVTTRKGAEREVSAVKKELNIANKSVKQLGKILDEWVKKYGHLHDPVGVLEHGRKCIRPGHKKYKEQFIDPCGRCTKIRKASLACQIFDPFVLKDASVIALELLAQNEPTHQQEVQEL